MRQQIVKPGEGPSYDWANDHLFIKAAGELSGGRVTLAEDTLKPGFHLPRHHHRAMTEIFYMLEGEAEFAFDDETVVATPRTTISVPPNVWHEVRCAKGGKLLTIFTPGGFDRYMVELAGLRAEQFANPELMRRLAERYDIWNR